MPDPIPCPACGSEVPEGASACPMCGHRFAEAQSNAGAGKCARCGADVPRTFDFCPVCGQDQRKRRARPHTPFLRMRPAADPALGNIPPPGGSGAPAGMQEAAVETRSVPPPVAQPAAHPVAPAPPAAVAAAVSAAVHAAPAGQARLVVVERDGSEGRSFALDRDIITVGRLEGEVTFEGDPFVSPIHARLERNGGRWTLSDLGSRNGVYRRIAGSEPVFPGDVFMVGRQVLRLEPYDAAAEPGGYDEYGTRVFGTPVSAAWARLSLVRTGGGVAANHGLRGDTVVLGRESGDLVFPTDAFLSRQHARLRMERVGDSMKVFLEDLDSANGTYLRIRGATEIAPGDTFRVGDEILRLRAD